MPPPDRVPCRSPLRVRRSVSTRSGATWPDGLTSRTEANPERLPSIRSRHRPASRGRRPMRLASAGGLVLGALAIVLAADLFLPVGRRSHIVDPGQRMPVEPLRELWRFAGSLVQRSRYVRGCVHDGPTGSRHLAPPATRRSTLTALSWPRPRSTSSLTTTSETGTVRPAQRRATRAARGRAARCCP